MPVISLLAVRCDFCGMHLTGFQASNRLPAEQYADAPPSVSWTGIATFESIPEAEDAAHEAGWETADERARVAGRVIIAFRCQACRNRRRAMVAWIDQNRVITDVPDH